MGEGIIGENIFSGGVWVSFQKVFDKFCKMIMITEVAGRITEHRAFVNGSATRTEVIQT